MATRPIKEFKQGTNVFIRIETRDLTDVERPLFTPANFPTILLRDSLGAVQVNYAAMTQESAGVFTYSYQTTTAKPLGVWQIGFKIVGATQTTYTPEVDAFKLIP